MSSTRGGHNSHHQREETDAQVAQIRNDPRPLSLCDVVTEELLVGRHPDRPILSRLGIVGEIAHRGPEPVRNALESVVGITTKRVNSEDPSGGLLRTKVVQTRVAPPTEEGGAPTTTTSTTVQTSTVSITGVCVEYTGHFVAVFESEPQHLVELVRELRSRVTKTNKDANKNTNNNNATPKPKSGSVDATQSSSSPPAGNKDATSTAQQQQQQQTSFADIHIVYQVDDIIARGTSLWTHIDASNPDNTTAAAAGGANSRAATNAASNNTAALYSAVPLNDQIVKAVYNLISLGVHAQGLSSRAMREQFSSGGAVSTHVKFLPPQSFILGCIKSDLCLTINEFLTIFGKLPLVDREKELLNPLEPPLTY